MENNLSHKIDEGFEPTFEHDWASSFGKGSNKELYVKVDKGTVTYCVRDHDKLIIETTKYVEAVQAYNKLI